jgi:hypothetical protein
MSRRVAAILSFMSTAIGQGLRMGAPTACSAPATVSAISVSERST